MGHRSNFVIIRNHAAIAYYDQWAALGAIYTFSAGPAGAVDALVEMRVTDELIEWAFAEGGYLLDLDQKLAIVFGYSCDCEEFGFEFDAETEALNAALEESPLKFLQHIAPAWPGWKLIWDDRGVDAFAEYLHGRGITCIQTCPASHPADTPEPVSFQA